jgi:cytochrome c peroxidase
MARLGRALFYDPRISGSGALACASCHRPDHAYGPSPASPLTPGGLTMQDNARAVPSLRYLYRQPAFSIGPDASGDNDNIVSVQQQAQAAASQVRAVKRAQTPQVAATSLVPQGGLFWDGRADTLQSQANGPLFNPAEMNAGTPARVAALLARSAYAPTFRLLFGQSVFENPSQAVAEAMFALARFQIEDRSFHPFNSKFDAWLMGRARFTPVELRGYQAFNDPQRGNCAACHIDHPTRDGLPPLFTDFQYEALGVPRNPAIAANRDPQYFDLGLCGPLRSDLREQTQYCGMFATPSLRNVAQRQVYFHNGVFHTLARALDWYVNRDLQPQRFYPRDKAGRIVKFDDLPHAQKQNVDTVDAPFNRHPGDAPALTPSEVRDLRAFLATLNDGYAENESASKTSQHTSR